MAQALNLEQLVGELPDILQPGVLTALEALQEQDEFAPPPALQRSLLRTVACSEYAATILQRYPSLMQSLFESGDLQCELESGELHHRCMDATAKITGETEFMRALRVFRHRELVRIAWRDLNGAPLPATLADLSSLADAALSAALSWAKNSLLERYGKPVTAAGREAQLVILAMGKLGGGELNFSSDIDLVLLFSEQGDSDGRQSVVASEYFRMLSQRIIKVLDERTVDGFVYRVDVRLRPFGNSGPLAVSETAFEEYLMRHGRDWERYAYVKTRVVNAWDGTNEFYETVLRPFVYRRYLDYGVFSSLREMKAMIEAEGHKKGMQDHVKLGPGGIREVEFIVQTLQLVRGGSIGPLRERRLLPALTQLVEHNLLPSSDADELAAAYCYLRQVENRIQSIHDRQTHELPTNAIDRARLCLAMQTTDWAELVSTLDAHRKNVQRHFNRTLRRNDEDTAEVVSVTSMTGLWTEEAVPESVIEELGELGFSEPAEIPKQLAGLRLNSAIQRLDQPGRARLDRLLPQIITACSAESSPDAALTACLKVIEGIGRRSAYFALLNENPAALQRLVSLAARSNFLAAQVAVHPLLLDELLDPRVFSQTPQRTELEADLQLRLTNRRSDDPEQQLEGILNFQQAAVFRTAVADLSSVIPLMKVSDRLTDVAELVVQAALDLALNEMLSRHGEPMCDEGSGLRPASFGVLGYGKLGGLELGYGSDLDLVFIHDSAGEQQLTTGDRPLDNAVFFARLAQRLIHMLTMQTLSGRLYEVDTRLRPSGNSGQIVSNLRAFDKYQRNDAWTWEHQALLRSRAIAGSDVIQTKFAEVRKTALTGYVRVSELHADVLKMRRRMRTELDKTTAEFFHIKQGFGGVVDIEFMVQYLVLANAADNVELIVWSDNIRQLDALAKAGIMEPEHAEQLADIYRDYRGCLHRLSLGGKGSLIAKAELGDSPALVVRLWQKYLGENSA